MIHPMRAWLLREKTGLDGLAITQVNTPVPAAHEVLVAVEFAALNPADYYLAENQYPSNPPMPHVLGREGVGRVISVGKDVQSLQSGEQVVVLRGDTGVSRWGTFADCVVVEADRVVSVPDGWTAQEAAGAPLVYLTAYQALTQWGELPPMTVLVSGASGGVGVACIQLGTAMGHRVIGLSRSKDKISKLKQIGAIEVLDPHDPDLIAKIKALAGRDRIGLAVDNIGGKGFTDIVDVMGMHGRISVVGQLDGPVERFKTASLLFRRVRIGGVSVGAYTTPQALEAWRQIIAMMDQSRQRPLVDSIWPFEQLPQAFARLKQGPLGKVILKVGESA